MLYKFDILFKKELKGGGLKVVTYSHLLEHPDTYGQGETLEGAVGTLSLTDSEKENGYSISSLFVRYRTQLVGCYWAEVFGKEFPLQFSFDQPDDVSSIRAVLCDENGYYYSSDVQTLCVNDTKTLDMMGQNTFVAFVPKIGVCTITDADSEFTLQPGQLALVPAACKLVCLKGHCIVKSIKCVN